MVTATATKKILFLDTVYPEFLQSLPPVKDGYEAELQAVLNRTFGTFDAYSRALRAQGWNAVDVIANHASLQHRWARSDRWSLKAIALQQIDEFRPDVLFLQDLSFFDIATLQSLSEKYLLVGQCSCPMPDPAKVRRFSILLTSFPHYIARFEALGVKAFYVPLAFDDSILNRIEPAERIHDVAFVGGVGRPSHWKAGMEVLGTVAREIPTSRFWGYGYDLLPKDSPIVKNYYGQAWGLDMFNILAQSKISIARHGEVAEGYSNNMKLFEISGMGALMMTEESKNLRDFFTGRECVAYSSPADAVDKIRYYLWHDDERREIAAAGQARTLRDHTYSQRMAQISEILHSCLN